MSRHFSSTFIFSLLFTLHNNISMLNASPIIGQEVKPVEDKEFPFIVSLGFFEPSEKNKRYRNHFCGGSLITRRHVLTSAHCLDNKTPSGVVVTVGNVNLNEGKIYTLESWKTYDEWATENNVVIEYSSNDIAVVVLAKNVTEIVPAVRSNLSHEEVFNKKVVTAGWGRMLNNSRPKSLQKAQLRVLTPEGCMRSVIKLFGKLDLPPKDLYCTSAPKCSSSHSVVLGCGDSGGPLLLKDTNEIVAVNKATCKVEESHKNPHAINLHASVDYFKIFIDDFIDNSLKE